MDLFSSKLGIVIRRSSAAFLLACALFVFGVPNVSAQTTATAEPKSVSYGLLIDHSGSAKDSLTRAVATAKKVISANAPNDETFIVRFISSDKIETLQEFTRDKNKLLNSLSDPWVEGGQTAIIDAVYLAAQHLTDKSSNPNAHHALVIITDGDEGMSFYKKETLVKLLHEKRIPVLVLAYVNGVKKRGEKQYLRALDFVNMLARESGGKLILVERRQELENKAPEIIDWLRGS
jgi:uncharacterized protein with von Willebrand factor type A (vWA) domain